MCLTTLITFFINNILSIWFIIELNFLCFVRIIRHDLNKHNTNGNIYYFLVQSLGRVLILISSLSFLISRNFLFEFIFVVFLILKLGGAPFQFWYLKLIQKLGWTNIWLMSAWQKLIPLLIIKIARLDYLIIFGGLRVISGRLNNLNQKKIKKILGLSSIFSLGWVLLSISQRKIWLIFMLGYSIVLGMLLNSLKRLSCCAIDNLENLNFSVIFYSVFFLGLLIIRGIPPFIIFYIKILILYELIQLSLAFVLSLLVVRVFIIYIYLIMGFRILTFFKSKTFFSRYYLGNIHFLDYVLYNLLTSVLYIRFL